MDEHKHNRSKDEKTWAMLTHAAAFTGYITVIGFILGPLIVWLIKKEEYPIVDHHGKEALNFQISIIIYYIISTILALVLIGILGFFIIGILQLIFMIIATVKAADGERYQYPFTIRFLK